MAATTPVTPAQLQLLLDSPASTPPAGKSASLRSPPNLNTFLILTLILAETLTTIAVLTRIYAKGFIVRRIASEDYTVVIGRILQIALVIPAALSTRHGAGYHMWDIGLRTFLGMLYWTNISAILYCPVVLLVKLSILLQYLRIFVPNRKGNMSMYIAIHTLMWGCSAIYSVCTILAVVQCIPRERIWNPLTVEGHCINTGATYLATAIFNVITDFVILILPMPSLWKLKMPKKKKILTTAVFSTGSLACITSVVRTYYAGEIAKSHDISYNVAKMGFWTFAEMCIGIIVSCAPVLPKFFRHFGSKLYETFSSSDRSRKGLRPFDKLYWRPSGEEAPVLPTPAFVKNDNLASGHFDMNDFGEHTIMSEDQNYVPIKATKREDLENGINLP